jgi:hypothetical protein
MVTAELAVALPAVVLVAVAVLSALGCALDTIRCVDAARATARLLARGDPPSVALSEGHRLAPTGAALSVSTSASEVEVRVVDGRRGPGGWLGGVLPLVASGEAVAAREDLTPADEP